jgi:hypothetical protein
MVSVAAALRTARQARLLTQELPCENPACEAGLTLRHQLATRRLMGSDDSGGDA